jgi:hypothetical protein
MASSSESAFVAAVADDLAVLWDDVDVCFLKFVAVGDETSVENCLTVWCNLLNSLNDHENFKLQQKKTYTTRGLPS